MIMNPLSALALWRKVPAKILDAQRRRYTETLGLLIRTGVEWCSRQKSISNVSSGQRSKIMSPSDQFIVKNFKNQTS